MLRKKLTLLLEYVASSKSALHHQRRQLVANATHSSGQPLCWTLFWSSFVQQSLVIVGVMTTALHIVFVVAQATCLEGGRR